MFRGELALYTQGCLRIFAGRAEVGSIRVCCMISKASDIVYEYVVQCFVWIILGLSVSKMNFGMVTRFKLRDFKPKVGLGENQEEFRTRDMRKDATRTSWRHQGNEGYII